MARRPARGPRLRQYRRNRRRRPAYPLEGVKKDESGTALGYFENNAHRMCRKWFRSRVLCTGSGVVEFGRKRSSARAAGHAPHGAG